MGGYWGEEACISVDLEMLSSQDLAEFYDNVRQTLVPPPPDIIDCGMFRRNGVIPPYHYILNICHFIENKNKTNLIIIVFNIRLFSVFLRMEVARLLRLCLPFMVKSELSLLSIIKSQYRLYHHINSVSKCTNIIEISRETIPGYFNWTLSLNLGSKFIFKSETS